MAKRILIFTNHFFPENFKVNEIADVLVEEGNIVHVVTGIPNYPTGNFYPGFGFFSKSFERKNENFTIRRLPLVPRGSGSKPRLIINYISYMVSVWIYTIYLALFKEKFDLIFVHHTSPIFITIPPVFYRWARKSKNILWDLDMWPDTLNALGIINSKRITSLLERVMKWIYQRYDHVLLGSKSFLDRAKTRIEEQKFSYFPNWAEKIFTDSKYSIPPIEPEFPIGLKIMYAGNIGVAQDFENVVKAIQLLKKEPIHWLFVGDGRNREWLQSQIENLGLNDKVIFYGNQNLEHMPYYFSKADVMFLSIKNEKIFQMTVPAKLQAYMGFGKPVLGMISGEGGQIIQEANGGFVVESGDSNALAQKIRIFLDLELSEREKMGNRNKAYYETNFSLEARKDQLKKLIYN